MIVPLRGNKIDWATLEKIPSVAALATCPQEPEHHGEGDVLTHTKMVTEAGEKLAQKHNLSPEETEDLLFACIFHDIAKPITLQKGEDGKWSSRKHALKGTAFLRFLFWEENSTIPLNRREKLLNLVRLHAWPVRFIERPHPEDSVIRASLVTSNKLLSLLAIADMTGRICENKRSQTQAIEAAKLFLEYSKELGCLDTPFPFENGRSKLHYLKNNGDSNPNLTLFQPEGFEVTLMSGIPCSGKDQWLEKNYSHPVISRDIIRKTMGFPNEGEVLQEFTSQIKKALAKKEPFAINATNLRKELRENFTSLISTYGGTIQIVYLQADKGEVFKRLKNREKDLPEKEGIPTSAILKMAEGAEPPTALECHKLIMLDTNPAPKKEKKPLHQEPEPDL